jgi:hypothetical protein
MRRRGIVASLKALDCLKIRIFAFSNDAAGEKGIESGHRQ